MSPLDRIITGNKDFVPTFHKLAAMVKQDYQIILLRGLLLYLELANGPEAEKLPNVAESLPTVVAAPLVLTAMHLERGTPLYLSDELLELWSTSDGTVAECERCGYRHPQSIRQCVLCGGTTGEGGVWAKRRARAAATN